MYSVFIVDDEKRVRDGLSSMIHWQRYNMRVDGRYSNGSCALEALDQTAPDIIVSDIKMPVMDGIALRHAVGERYPGTKFIIISGYDDVAYMKAAIQSDVVDYVFKPINIAEIESVLARLQTQMDEEARKQKNHLEMAEKLKESMPLLKERFLLNLLAKPISAPLLDARCRFLNLDLLGSFAYQIAVMSIDNASLTFSSYSEAQLQAVSLDIAALCEARISGVWQGLVGTLDVAEYVLLLCLPEKTEPEEVVCFLKNLKNTVSDQFGVSATIGLSQPFTSLGDAGRNFNLAQDAGKQRLYLGKNQVILFDVLENDYTPYSFAPATLIKFRQALKAGDSNQAEKVIDRLFTDIRTEQKISLPTVRNLSLQLFLISENVLEEACASSGVNAQSKAFEHILHLDTLDDIRLLLLEISRNACGKILSRKQKRRHSAVEQVKAIINERYSSHLTIQALSEHVYLAPQYLCVLFKQETGQTINDYITSVRVESAKKLLKERCFKLYDVCTQVGYTDPSYFTKIFKRTTGMTPSEYRDSE